MKIERVEVEPCSYPLRAPFRSAAGDAGERRGFVLRIHTVDGAFGRGEALPLPSSGTEPLEQTENALRAAEHELRTRDGELSSLLDFVDDAWPTAPAARCAIDTALHDLEAAARGIPIARLLVRAPRSAIPVNAVIPANDEDASVAAARRAADAGYRTLKLKVGRDSLDADVRRVARVRAAVGPKVRLRADANGSWSLEQAGEALARLGASDLELLEQPVRDLDDLSRLREISTIPLAADEVLASAAGRERLVMGRLADVAVLKPMVLGGLRACVRLARAARRVNVPVFVTTTFDGPIATAAALQLAAAVGDATLASGLAASDIVDAPFPAGLVARRGRLLLPAAPGLGLEDPA